MNMQVIPCADDDEWPTCRGLGESLERWCISLPHLGLSIGCDGFGRAITTSNTQVPSLPVAWSAHTLRWQTWEASQVFIHARRDTLSCLRSKRTNPPLAISMSHSRPLLLHLTRHSPVHSSSAWMASEPFHYKSRSASFSSCLLNYRCWMAMA